MTRRRWLIVSVAAFLLIVAGLGIAGTIAFRELVSAPFRETELSKRTVTSLLGTDQTRITAILQGDAFCIVGVGEDPHRFAKRRFPSYSYFEVSEDDPFFLRSDSHWHIVTLIEVSKKYEVIAVPVSKIILPDVDAQPLCARDFNLAVEKRGAEGAGVSVLTARPL